MKKIILNGDYLAFDTFAGVSRYATEIFKELDELLADAETIMVTPTYTAKLPVFKNIKVVKYGDKSLLKWKNTDLPRFVKNNSGLLVDLTQAFPIAVRGISCVHDCIPEMVDTAYSGWAGKYIRKPLKLLQRRIVLKNSLAVVTVSEFSKNDISRIHKIPKSKITVAGNAWQHIVRTDYDNSIIEKYNLTKDGFYFSLSSRVPHKNLQWIVSAAKQNSEDIFVVSGENKYSRDFDKDAFPRNIIFTGYISDGEIRSLMANCKAFVLPSFYEGFGIPPLEALAEGAQIVVSNSSCLPEIYGDTAHYIDPYNLNNIDLDSILSDKTGDAQKALEKYSWKMSAEKLYHLILTYIE